MYIGSSLKSLALGIPPSPDDHCEYDDGEEKQGSYNSDDKCKIRLGLGLFASVGV